MSVKSRSTECLFSSAFISLIASKSSFFMLSNTDKSTTSSCPTPIFSPPMLKSLKSLRTKALFVSVRTSDLIINISIPRAFGSSIWAIRANSLTAFVSSLVHVGDLKITVSLKIADIIIPAKSFGISTPK